MALTLTHPHIQLNGILSSNSAIFNTLTLDSLILGGELFTGNNSSSTGVIQADISGNVVAESLTSNLLLSNSAIIDSLSANTIQGAFISSVLASTAV